MVSYLLLMCNLVLSVLKMSEARELGTDCTFTIDCQNNKLCKNIQDASCQCVFGNCTITGGWSPVFRQPECETYRDCPCRNRKSECYCKSGQCSKGPYECHRNTDCLEFEKCKNGDCTCSGNTCERECRSARDCVVKSHHCTSALGYKCKCENYLCGFEKVQECKTKKECLDKGFCDVDNPCQCQNDACSQPWWYNNGGKLNCRKDQDCEDFMISCGGGQCQCSNIKNINRWDVRGTCIKRTIPRGPKDSVVFNN